MCTSSAGLLTEFKLLDLARFSLSEPTRHHLPSKAASQPDVNELLPPDALREQLRDSESKSGFSTPNKVTCALSCSSSLSMLSANSLQTESDCQHSIAGSKAPSSMESAMLEEELAGLALSEGLTS